MKVIAYLEEGDVRILLVYEVDLDGCRKELQEAGCQILREQEVLEEGSGDLRGTGTKQGQNQECDFAG